MKRTLVLVLTALLLTAPANGQQPGAHHRGAPHELVIGDIQDVANLNPHLVTANSLGNLANLTMAYLVRYGPDSRPVPELATVVPTQANGGISKDGLRITWHLRRGVKWSDGAPFDGDDIVWSTNAVNNPANNEIGRDGWELITKIDEPDKFTVVYHLKKPYSGYLPSFFGSAGANPCILPKHILASLPNINNAPYNAKPVGIGPFRYVDWVRGDHITMEANPYYWRGQPKIKKIVYKFIPDRNTLLTQLQTGEVDLWPFVTPPYYERVAALPGVTVSKMPGYIYTHVDMNTSHRVMSDPVVRAAMRLATDRRAIQQKLNHGLGSVQENQITPASPFFKPVPLVPFDLAQANRILDAAGWKRGADGVRAKNGVRLALDFAVGSGSPDIDQRVELLRANWEQLGITFTVRHYSQALIFGPIEQGGILYGGKWDVMTYGWGQTPDADLRTTNGCGQMPPKGQNVTRLCDPQLEAILTRESAAYDEAPRTAAVTAGVKRISELVPYYVLFIQDNIHAYTSALTGWQPNATTPFDDFMQADV
ncbi:MAG: peptide/nickel transport system substrate-binding protein [Candidatus Eremiobacteraeota bacterium]|nr:peptide/nickel transport system substrate-binding protein [Candidatus Eremiobacteraeota bacterium]